MRTSFMQVVQTDDDAAAQTLLAKEQARGPFYQAV